jgi:hypothetical protein
MLRRDGTPADKVASLDANSKNRQLECRIVQLHVEERHGMDNKKRDEMYKSGADKWKLLNISVGDLMGLSALYCAKTNGY